MGLSLYPILEIITNHYGYYKNPRFGPLSITVWFCKALRMSPEPPWPKNDRAGPPRLSAVNVLHSHGQLWGLDISGAPKTW